MTDDLKLRQWDRCWPGNINLEVAVDEALARITDLEARLAAAEDKLYDAQSGPWPQWAASILTCLKDFGWRFDDLIDLPDELENYLRDYPDSAVTGLREQIDLLSTALAAAEADRDEAREYAAQARVRENKAEDARVSAVDRATRAEAENTRLKRQVETLKTGWGIADRDRIKAEAGEDALAEALARAHGWMKGPGDSLGPAIRQVEAAPADYEARRMK